MFKRIFSLGSQQKPKGVNEVEGKEQTLRDIPENVILKSTSIVLEGTVSLPSKNIQIGSSVGGARGWPSNVTALYYHTKQGLICVGTSCGVIHAFGDGFQFVRPCMTGDPIEVKHIAAASQDTLLVAFDDNSLVLLELPSLTVLDLLEGFWVKPDAGDVCRMYVDEHGGKNYAYIGTTKGHVYIVQVTGEKRFRICEYSIIWQDFDIPQEMVVTSIQTCPKDEKYLAVGFATKKGGAICVYNFMKKLPKFTFTTEHAVTSLAWHHTGEYLYVGTLGNSLECVSMESRNISSIWLASVGARCKTVLWMPPQNQGDTGCLFVLQDVPKGEGCALGDDDDDDDDEAEDEDEDSLAGEDCDDFGVDDDDFDLDEDVAGERDCNIVILAHSNTDSDAIHVIASIPVGSGQNVADATLVLSRDASRLIGDLSKTTAPALLMLSQRHQLRGDVESAYEEASSWVRNARADRRLKIVHFPPSCVSEWATMISLELADAENNALVRDVIDVLPSEAAVTCMAAFAPSRGSSIGTTFSSVLLSISAAAGASALLTIDDDGSVVGSTAGDDDDGNVGDEDASHGHSSPHNKHINIRRFIDTACDGDGKSHLSGVDKSKWAPVLATSDAGDFDKLKSKSQDVLLLGHSDGSIIAWGVFLPEINLEELGRGNVYMPLSVFHCKDRASGTSAAANKVVTVLADDDETGLFAAADFEGNILLLQTYESGLLNEADAVDALNDSLGCEDSAILSGRHNSIREAARMCVGQAVSALLIISEFEAIVAGTVEGAIFISLSFSSASKMLAVEFPKTEIHHGPVVGLHCHPFYHNGADVSRAIYAVFSDGSIAIISVATGSVLAYSGTMSRDMLSSSEKGSFIDAQELLKLEKVSAAFVLDANFQMLSAGDCSASLNPTQGEDNGNSETNPSPTSLQPSISVRGARVGTFVEMFRDTKTIDKIRSLALPVPIPSQGASFFIFVKGNTVFTYDLAKLATLSPQHGPNIYSLGVKDALIVNSLGKQKVVASSLLSYVEAESRAWADPTAYLACLNTSGIVSFLSVTRNFPVAGRVALLETLAEKPIRINSGLVLPSGNCYMLQNNELLYNVSLFSDDYIMPSAPSLPDRIVTATQPPSPKLSLSTGAWRSSGGGASGDDAGAKKGGRRRSMFGAATDGRRRSIFTVATDIDKVFSTCRVDRKPLSRLPSSRERSGSTVSERSPSPLLDKATSSNTTNASSASNFSFRSTSASSAASVSSRSLSNNMAQLGESFQKRGEKLSEIAQRMEAFRANAQDFRKNAAAHKAALKKKEAALSFGGFF